MTEKDDNIEFYAVNGGPNGSRHGGGPDDHRPGTPPSFVPFGSIRGEKPGRVKLEETETTHMIIIVPDDGSEEVSYSVPMGYRILVPDGTYAVAGQKLAHSN